MYTGNPHQDRNPFKSFTGGFQQGWEDRRPPFHGGGAIPMPKDTMEREGTPAIPMPEATWQKPAPWQGDAPWITRPPEKFWNDGTPFKQNPPEKFWNDGTLSNDPNMIQLLNTGEHESSHLTGGPLAELTQEQMDFMGSPYNTPAFGVSKEDLWNRTKGMEKKGFFGWGAQEPTTQQEFNDYYNQLEQGESGNWLAMAGKKKGPLATVPGSRIAPNVPEHSGFSDDMFKQDPHRTYNHGYRYNNYGLQPLYFG